MASPYLNYSLEFIGVCAKRYHLRKAAVKQLIDQLKQKFGADVEELMEGVVELIELENHREVVLVDGKPFLLKTDKGVFPTLASLERVQLKHIVVDMGAVPYIANGADVMAPGVVQADEGISLGDVVAIVDERHGKPLAIGLALVASDAMKAPKGKVVENLHHVGDDVWNLLTHLREKVK